GGRARRPPDDLLRLRVRLRGDDGAARLLLRHGRQPQQLSGQPLLGVRPQGQDQGQGLPDLLVLGQRSALAALVETREIYPVVGGGRTIVAGSVVAGSASPAQIVGGPSEMVSGSAPRSSVLGFYLHVPFCVQRCHYCSFNTAPLEAGPMDPYLRALPGEL